MKGKDKKYRLLFARATENANCGGNSFFSLPKCKVVFVRWYLTCKVVPYKKILVENERPYKKPCKVVPYKKIYLKMSAYIKSHVGLHLTCKVVPYKKIIL